MSDISIMASMNAYRKAYKRVTVTKGELVLDQNLNPLPNGQSAKSISLSSYLANNLSKVGKRMDAAGNRFFKCLLSQNLNLVNS